LRLHVHLPLLDRTGRVRAKHLGGLYVHEDRLVRELERVGELGYGVRAVLNAVLDTSDPERRDRVLRAALAAMEPEV